MSIYEMVLNTTYHKARQISKNEIRFLKDGHCILYSTQCLKITEKVAFNIASEASYVYILSGQKFIKNAKMLENQKFAIKQCYQTSNF